MKIIILAIILSFLALATILPQTVSGFVVHDLDYENSPYDNKKMPLAGQQMKLFYQVVNITPQNQSYDVTISITNLDEHEQVYHASHHYDIKLNEFEDVIWSFTPQTEGLYSVDVKENMNKTATYFFAVTKDDAFRQAAKKNLTLLEDKSPRQQFRMGIDPKEIKCKDNLFFAFRQSGLPVCLKLDTLKELRQRSVIVQENIDYERIGYVESESQAKKILAEKNIQYDQDKFLLITGFSLLSLPPTTDYCGYVQDKDNMEHWFSSSYHFDNLSNIKISDKNPSPCEPSTRSCFCYLETKLAEINPTLSYFTKSEEKITGLALSDYLNKTKIANVSNEFVVGKYNLESSLADIHYCGKFTDGSGLKGFEGYIKNGKVVDFSLATEKSKLCAISDDARTFTFDKSSIVPDPIGGK